MLPALAAVVVVRLVSSNRFFHKDQPLRMGGNRGEVFIEIEVITERKCARHSNRRSVSGVACVRNLMELLKGCRLLSGHNVNVAR